MKQIQRVIKEIESTITEYKEEKRQEVEADNLARALVLSWAIAGLYKAIGVLYRVSQETKENDGTI